MLYEVITQAADGGDTASFMAFGLAADADDAVAGRLMRGFGAEALPLGLAASRADPALLS